RKSLLPASAFADAMGIFTLDISYTCKATALEVVRRPRIGRESSSRIPHRAVGRTRVGQAMGDIASIQPSSTWQIGDPLPAGFGVRIGVARRKLRPGAIEPKTGQPMTVVDDSARVSRPSGHCFHPPGRDELGLIQTTINPRTSSCQRRRTRT